MDGDPVILVTVPNVCLQNDVAALLKPISEKIQEIQTFRERNRGSKMFNHLSAVSESIPALGWIAVVSWLERRPAPPHVSGVVSRTHGCFQLLHPPSVTLKDDPWQAEPSSSFCPCSRLRALCSEM